MKDLLDTPVDITYVAPTEWEKLEERNEIAGLMNIPTFVQMILDDTEKNFEERLRRATEATGITLEAAGVKEAIHHELSFIRYNNKAQLLFTKQVMLWNINKKALEESLDVDGKNDVEIRNKISDLQDKLEEKIAQLYQEMGKEKQIIDVMKEQVKATMSPEQRIKRKKLGV